MKTLEEIKSEVAKEFFYPPMTWEEASKYSNDNNICVLEDSGAINEVAKRYATEYAKEVQRFWDDGEFCVKSILSEDNLPSHE